MFILKIAKEIKFTFMSEKVYTLQCSYEVRGSFCNKIYRRTFSNNEQGG